MEEREPSVLKPEGLAEGSPAAEPAPAPVEKTEAKAEPTPAASARAERDEPPAVAARAEIAAEPAPRLRTSAPTVYVAGFWRRSLAALVDAAAIVPVAFLITLLAGRLAGLSLPEAQRTGIDYWIDLALAGEPALWGSIGLFLAIVVIYLLVFQAMAGRTPGMRLLRLRIIDPYGEPPGVIRAIVRTVGYVVGICSLSLGFLWIGFDREKRGLHDWLAGTYVIKAAPRGGT
jgi:uncharacterized RDD family membrane protein YckC